MNKLSMIVPVYNDEKNIENSINSLLSQTSQVDIIVVDDGSTDETSNILEELKNKHDNIHYYKKENEGIAAARNFGVDKVKTEYFGFLDSDDTCRNDMAERMLSEIEKTNSDICFSNFVWVYPNGKRKEITDTGYKNKKEILIKMFATLWNKIYRTSWFKNTSIYFPEGLKYEDASILYRLVVHMDKICYVDDYFVQYIQRKGSITHTYNLQVEDMISVFSGIKEYYVQNDYFDFYKEEIEYLFIRFFLGNSYLRACKIKDKTIRNKVLNRSWDFLNNNFPCFRKNKYINTRGIKNIYFRNVSREIYLLFSSFINLISL